MNNPFDALKAPKKQDLNYDEWEGQFSCSTYRCNGYAKVARYFTKQRLLTWECQEGHISRLEDVDE